VLVGAETGADSCTVKTERVAACEDSPKSLSHRASRVEVNHQFLGKAHPGTAFASTGLMALPPGCPSPRNRNSHRRRPASGGFSGGQVWSGARQPVRRLDRAPEDEAKMTIKITPECTPIPAEKAGTAYTPNQMASALQERWLPVNFRLQIAGYQTACSHGLQD